MVGEVNRLKLIRLTRSTTTHAGVVLRVRIVLAASEGVANSTIAELVGVSAPTVLKWGGRHHLAGLAGLNDLERSG